MKAGVCNKARHMSFCERIRRRSQDRWKLTPIILLDDLVHLVVNEYLTDVGQLELAYS